MDLSLHHLALGSIRLLKRRTHAQCFLRLANLPSCPLDRLSRYEAVLWRQAGQILFALDALDRRKPQERGRHFHVRKRQELLC